MNEPTLPPDHILVVDDGARGQAEKLLPGIRWVPGIKPFNYARNVNLGITEAGTDVILLNDDARLTTCRGFSRLSEQTRQRLGIGICSAGIHGLVGNLRQRDSRRGEFRLETRTMAFVCAYIPRDVYTKLGPLDERFSGYGFEDDDYCARVLAAGYELGIWDGCVVDHSGELPSTFRSRADIWSLFQQNRWLFREKWGRDSWLLYRFKIWLTLIGTILVIASGYYISPYLVYGVWFAAVVWLWLDDLIFQYRARAHEKLKRFSPQRPEE